MYYQKHIFLCQNQKALGKPCCASGDPADMRSFMKKTLKKKGIVVGEGGIRLTLSGCLGRCSEGPLMVIYPEAVWYRYENQDDIEKIIDGHILNGNIVEELAI